MIVQLGAVKKKLDAMRDQLRRLRRVGVEVFFDGSPEQVGRDAAATHHDDRGGAGFLTNPAARNQLNSMMPGLAARHFYALVGLWRVNRLRC